MRSRRPFLACQALMAALAAASCGPQLRTVELRPTARGLNPVVPAFIASGDSLEVVVHDPDWSREYVVTTSEATRTEISRAPIFGAVNSLAKSAGAAFPLDLGPARQMRAAFMAVADGSEEKAEPAWPVSTSEVEAWLAAPWNAAEKAAALRAAHASLAGYRDQMAEVLDRRAEGVNAALGDLRGRLAKSPDEVRALRFLADTVAHRVLIKFSDDGTAARLQAMLQQAVAAGSPTLDTLAVDTAFAQAGGYVRRLRAISALVPTVPDPSLETGEESLGATLGVLWLSLAEYDTAHARLDRATAMASRVAAELRRMGAAPPPEPVRAPSVALEPLEAAGVQLRPLLASDVPGGTLARLRSAVLTIDEHTRSIAEVSAQLPAWVNGPSKRVVYGHVFHGSETLTVAIKRRPHFSAFTFTPAASGGDAGSVAVKDAGAGGTGGTGGTAGTTGTGGQAAGDEAVATYTILLTQRYRFHVGAGFVYSPLETHTYTTTAETRDGVAGQVATETGVARNAVFPAMVVSYTLLPTSGRVLDGSADRNRLSLSRAGLSLQTGLSLSKPTEQLYFGLSSELLPGLSVGGGYSLSYLERSRSVGTFVPNTQGTPVRKRWLGRWGAFSLVVDADVFTSTIGKLF